MKIPLWIALVIVIAVGGWLWYGIQGQPASAPAEESPEIEGSPAAPSGQSSAPSAPSFPVEPSGTVAHVLVSYQNGAFSPSSVTIKRGETVRWTNNGPGLLWVASAMHPTHTLYPGTDIKKCGTPEESSVVQFDQCRGASIGSNWSFTFGSPGTWKYHNHLNPGATGEVIVE